MWLVAVVAVVLVVIGPSGVTRDHTTPLLYPCRSISKLYKPYRFTIARTVIVVVVVVVVATVGVGVVVVAPFRYRSWGIITRVGCVKVRWGWVHYPHPHLAY